MPRKVWMMEGPTTWQEKKYLKFRGSSQPKWAKKISKLSTTKAQYPTVSLTYKWHLQRLLVLRQPAISFKCYYSKKVKNPFYLISIISAKKIRSWFVGHPRYEDLWKKGHLQRTETEPPSRPVAQSPFDFFNHIEITGAKLLPAIYALHLHVLPAKGAFVLKSKIIQIFPRRDESQRCLDGFRPCWFIQVEAWCFRF